MIHGNLIRHPKKKETIADKFGWQNFDLLNQHFGQPPGLIGLFPIYCWAVKKERNRNSTDKVRTNFYIPSQ